LNGKGRHLPFTSLNPSISEKIPDPIEIAALSANHHTIHDSVNPARFDADVAILTNHPSAVEIAAKIAALLVPKHVTTNLLDTRLPKSA
jgi:hypothetical protein